MHDNTNKLLFLRRSSTLKKFVLLWRLLIGAAERNLKTRSLRQLHENDNSKRNQLLWLSRVKTHLFRPSREEPGIGGAGAHVTHLLPHGPSDKAAAIVTHSQALHNARHLPGPGTQTTWRRAVSPRPCLPRWIGAPAGSHLTHLPTVMIMV